MRRAADEPGSLHVGRRWKRSAARPLAEPNQILGGMWRYSTANIPEAALRRPASLSQCPVVAASASAALRLRSAAARPTRCSLSGGLLVHEFLGKERHLAQAEVDGTCCWECSHPPTIPFAGWRRA